MTERDLEDFNRLMILASSMTVMPNGKPLNAVSGALFLGLEPYPFDTVRKAVLECCRKNRFFPMLADIVAQIEGNAEERAAEAWGLVLRSIQIKYVWNSVRFPDPAIHYALERMGGWRHLCEVISDENEDFKARDFMRYYAIGERIACWPWQVQEGRRPVPAYFPSEVEESNRRLGYDEPVRVYDALTGELVDNRLLSLEPHRTKADELAKLVAGKMSL